MGRNDTGRIKKEKKLLALRLRELWIVLLEGEPRVSMCKEQQNECDFDFEVAIPEEVRQKFKLFSERAFGTDDSLPKPYKEKMLKQVNDFETCSETARLGTVKEALKLNPMFMFDPFVRDQYVQAVVRNDKSTIRKIGEALIESSSSPEGRKGSHWKWLIDILDYLKSKGATPWAVRGQVATTKLRADIFEVLEPKKDYPLLRKEVKALGSKLGERVREWYTAPLPEVWMMKT